MVFSTLAIYFIDCFGKKAGEEICSDIRWKTGNQKVTMDAEDFSKEDLEKFLAYAKDNNPALYNKLSAWNTLRTEPDGAAIKGLQQLRTALIARINKTPHKFVFMPGDDDSMQPWLCISVRFHEAYTRDHCYYPAHTDLEIEALYRDKLEEEKIIFYDQELLGRKNRLSEILAKKKVFIETPEAFTTWENSLPRYYEISKKMGVQFLASGYGYAEDDNWYWQNNTVVSLLRDGKPSRCVVDDEGDPDKDDDRRHRKKQKDEPESTVRFNSFWDGKKDEECDDVDDKYKFIRPIQTYVQIFSFESHSFVEVHVDNLVEYKYAEDLEKKLIIDPKIKRLVTVLIEGAAHGTEDIVQGKSGGVIVIATGYPGTGKTLTAEVYSEQIKRPLYAVQCSQLGTDEEELEENLITILARATRWGSILLIDEADVYVRARENDLQQNAIVGVFLRLLERFQGVLFMTSNRATAIDDAILSRAIAHVKYELPNDENLALIWEVLGENYKAGLMPADIKALVKEFPGISGRNVKTLLKLATAVSRKNDFKRGVIMGLIRDVATYVDFPKKGDK